MDRKPMKGTTVQNVGVVLEAKKEVKMGLTLRVARIYWFGMVENLNQDNEEVFAREEDKVTWVPLSSITLVKKAISE
jgi:hypothetical protein